jgi:hypothetical protein
MWMIDGNLPSTSWELKLNLWVFWDARVESGTICNDKPFAHF